MNEVKCSTAKVPQVAEKCDCLEKCLTELLENIDRLEGRLGPVVHPKVERTSKPDIDVPIQEPERMVSLADRINSLAQRIRALDHQVRSILDRIELLEPEHSLRKNRLQWELEQRIAIFIHQWNQGDFE